MEQQASEKRSMHAINLYEFVMSASHIFLSGTFICTFNLLIA